MYYFGESKENTDLSCTYLAVRHCKVNVIPLRKSKFLEPILCKLNSRIELRSLKYAIFKPFLGHPIFLLCV